MKHTATTINSILVSVAVFYTCATTRITAAVVGLQQPTATFSQTFVGDFSIARAIDGTAVDNRGWAIASGPSTVIPSQTAAFETASNVGFAGGSLITFQLIHFFSGDFPLHTLGRFRLSITTDNRSLFADGLASGGDVTANWTVLDPNSFVSANGATLTKLADLSIRASGLAPLTDVYTISAVTLLTDITGIRLEAIEDPSLPFGGPGRNPGNGNFVLSEFGVDIAPIPEPSVFALVALAGLAMVSKKTIKVAKLF